MPSKNFERIWYSEFILAVKVFDANRKLKDFGPIMFGAAVCSPNGVQLFCAPSLIGTTPNK